MISFIFILLRFLRIWILVPGFLLIPEFSFSQSWALDVGGSVEKNNKNLDGAVVTLYKNGSQVNQVTTSNNGKFSFRLEPNAEYILTFTKAGHITKKVSVSTHGVPPSRSEHGFAPYKMDVSIFENIPGVDLNSLLSQPIAKIKYNPTTGVEDFENDDVYTESIKSQLERLRAAEEDARKKAELLEKSYQAAIQKGDKAFSTKGFLEAKTAYNEALGIKPNEKYPKDKLAEIDKILASDANKANEIKKLEEQYKSLISKADASFAAKDYPNARSTYNQATSLKPSEKYPKDKIAEIDKILNELSQKSKELNEKYAAAISKGDKAFTSKDYNGAKTSYSEALNYKPAEKYPKDKITEIDKLLAELAANAAKDKQYNDAIARADKAFASKDYSNAKTIYAEASGMRSYEKYPKDRIAEIDRILADIAAGSAKEKQYNDAITRADKAFNTKDYTGAKTAYIEASGIKPAEKYPKDKIAEIEKILAELNAKASKEKQYADAIAKADKAFTAKDYTTAKISYSEASGIKPTEKYPKDKIAEIDKLLSEMAAGAAKEKQYADAIVKADKAFAVKDYNGAKSSYSAASIIKPAEKYPKDKIAEIDKILADLAATSAKDKQYNDAISKGDKSFSGKDYAGAKTAYTEAAGIKPGEKYPKDKIAEIDRILAVIAASSAKEKQYNDAIEKADKAFNSKDYSNAKTAYTEASGIKPAEKYPRDRIAEIDRLVAEINAGAAKDKQYNEVIAKADKAFGNKDYPNAKNAYSEALNVKPKEKYPKDRIDEIDRITAAADAEKIRLAKEAELKYADAIKRADLAFGQKNYPVARNTYREATGYKPDMQYPKEKISEIDKILASQQAERDRLAKEKELTDKYNNAVTTGNRLLGEKKYTEAKASYTEATKLKPLEKYPQDKIAQIDRLLKDQEFMNQKIKQYQDLIAKADAQFDNKEYKTAKQTYSEASGVLPNEKYPKDRMKECDVKLRASATIVMNNPTNTSVDKKKDEEERRKAFVNELVQKYPQGVTEEVTTDAQGKTIRRTVVKGSDAWVYIKRIYSYGTYWFKDGVPISEDTFEKETKKS